MGQTGGKILGQNGTSITEAAATLVIEQSDARRLLQTYQKRRASGGTYGPTRITKDIYNIDKESKRTLLDYDLSHNDIKHWLSGRTKRLGDRKFHAITKFIASSKFQSIVTECAASQPKKLSGRERMLSNLEGLWLISRRFLEKDVEPGRELAELLSYSQQRRQKLRFARNRDLLRSILNGCLPSFLCMKSVSGRDFLVAHLMNGLALSLYETNGLYASGMATQADDGRPVVRLKDRNDPHSESRYFFGEFNDRFTHRDPKGEACQLIGNFTLDSPSERHFLSYMNESLFQAYRCSTLIDLAKKHGFLRDEDKVFLEWVQKKFDAFSWGVISQEGE